MSGRKIKVGDRVMARPVPDGYTGVDLHYWQTVAGKQGQIVGRGLWYDWRVHYSEASGAHNIEELIHLGGKHAGLPHPNNGNPVVYDSLWSWEDEVFNAAYYGRHADHSPRLDEERDAYRAGF